MKKLIFILLIVVFSSCQSSNEIPITSQTSISIGMIDHLSDTSMKYDKSIVEFNNKLYVVSKDPIPRVIKVVDLANNSYLGIFLGIIIGLVLMLWFYCFIHED